MAAKTYVSDASWKIHKFGGSSLADASCFKRVADIIAEQPDQRIGVVVSAMRGMTDRLLRLTVMAERDDNGFVAELAELGEHFAATANSLVSGDGLVQLLDAWGNDAEVITESLVAAASKKSASQRTRDVVSGFGEIWSARLLAAYLQERLGVERAGTWIDARAVISVRHTELGPSVLWDKCEKNIARVLDAGATDIAVMTGFIAADADGLQTTLGRNGSDYSAAIFAALTSATELSIWTDVDGVMSADPNPSLSNILRRAAVLGSFKLATSRTTSSSDLTFADSA